MRSEWLARRTRSELFFSTNGYLANNPDVAAARINPLFITTNTVGRKDAIRTSFDTSSYLAAILTLPPHRSVAALSTIQYGRGTSPGLIVA
jgi:hypothetical protein